MSERNSVQNPSLLLAGQRPDTLIWRQQSGVFRSYDTPDRIVRVGTPGMADAGAIVAVTITPDMVGQTIGVAVQVEFKTSTGRQSNDQKLWQLATEKRSGVYSIVKSTNDMENLLNDISTGNHWR
jgi:hypothetical protein